MSCDDETCSYCSNLEEDIEDLQEEVERLKLEIEVLQATNGKGYDELPSTASRIKSMDELRRWVENHNKAHGK